MSFNIKPWGIESYEIIEDDSLDRTKIMSDGTFKSKDIIERNTSDELVEYALSWAQSTDNLLDITFTSKWGGNGVNETIDFFGTTVPCRNMSGTGNQYCYGIAPYIAIPDTNVAYEFSIWFYQTQKSAGSNYLGLFTYNNTTNVGVYPLTSDTANTNPYFITIGWNNSLFKYNKWTCWRGYLLPYWMNTSDLYSWCSSAWKYEDSDIFIYQGTSFRMQSSVVNNFCMRFLDYYNAGAQAYSWWALPTIRAINPLTIYRDRIVTMNIKEV